MARSRSQCWSIGRALGHTSMRESKLGRPHCKRLSDGRRHETGKLLKVPHPDGICTAPWCTRPPPPWPPCGDGVLGSTNVASTPAHFRPRPCPWASQARHVSRLGRQTCDVAPLRNMLSERRAAFAVSKPTTGSMAVSVSLSPITNKVMSSTPPRHLLWLGKLPTHLKQALRRSLAKESPAIKP